MPIFGVLWTLAIFMWGYMIGRAEVTKTDVIYVKERLYRFIKYKCYKNSAGETMYCGNRYIIDFNGELYMQTKGGYKKCISQK